MYLPDDFKMVKMVNTANLTDITTPSQSYSKTMAMKVWFHSCKTSELELRHRMRFRAYSGEYSTEFFYHEKMILKSIV